MSLSDDDKRSAAPAAAGKPTLEELLRVKRAERPDQVFWEEFDRGLRRKQLAAMVEPKPWWLGMTIWARRAAPLGLPASAAAAALLAIMVVRTQPSFSPSALSSDASRPAVGIAHAEKTTQLGAPSLAVSTSAGISSLAARANAAPASSVVADAPNSDPALASAEHPASSPAAALETSAVPVVDALLELGAAPSSPTPSEQTIAENLAAVHAETPDLIAASLPLSSEDGEATAGHALKMEVRNPRHARVLLAMADNPSAENPGGLSTLRDRFARTLDREDSLSGGASRLGVGGDRFSVSF